MRKSLPAALAALAAVGALARPPEVPEAVFKRCATCHTTNQGGANKVGPNLWNVVGGPHAHARDRQNA